MKKPALRGSVNNQTETRFPSMNHNNLTKSHPKFSTQLGLSSRTPLRAKKAPMMIIEDTILKAKIRMDTVNK